MYQRRRDLFKNVQFTGSFLFMLVLSKVNSKYCLRLDSNHTPLVLEATILPTEPQPLPALRHNFTAQPKSVLHKYS